jgi:hypothetical protein
MGLIYCLCWNLFDFEGFHQRHIASGNKSRTITLPSWTAGKVDINDNNFPLDSLENGIRKLFVLELIRLQRKSLDIHHHLPVTKDIDEDHVPLDSLKNGIRKLFVFTGRTDSKFQGIY